MPREGYLTPSSFADLMSNGRGTGSMGATALGVVERLALDMLGVERPEESTPSSCAWGQENEWEAIQTYQDRTLHDVVAPVPFATSTTHPYIGGSMDGLVGSVGGIEVKCPHQQREHLANLRSGKQIAQYIHQMQGYMFIFGLDWIDFVSFDPRWPESYQLFVRRVQRDDEHIKRIIERCELAYDMAVSIAAEMRDKPC